MKKFLLVLCIWVAVIIVLGSIMLAIHYYDTEVRPIWVSPSKVREVLVGMTPLGSSLQRVKSVIDANDWKIFIETPYKESFRLRKPYYSYPPVEGTYVIQVDFGEHPGFVFNYGVSAWWGFDSKGRLIDLKVENTAIAL